MSYLQQPVEGDGLDEEERHVLEHRKHAVDDPVREPLGVVLLGAGFYRLHRDVRRVGDADRVTQDLRGIAEGQVENHNGNTTWDGEKKSEKDIIKIFINALKVVFVCFKLPKAL